MENIYVVTYGWDSEEVGYFKSKNDAEEYCNLMNKNRRDYGGYFFQEFKLLNLEEEKKKIKYYYDTRVTIKIKEDILVWDITRLDACSTTCKNDIDNYTVLKVTDNLYEVSLSIESDDKRNAVKKLREIIGLLQEKYYESELLEQAISEVLE